MLVFKNHVGIITPDPMPLLQALPMAKSAPYKDSFVVAVPDHPECLQVVSNMGYEVEGSIKRQYEWPRRPGWEARWFQTATAEFMTLNRRGFVLSGMRVGKTLAALWALDHLQRTGCVKKALIVAPLSAMELAWADTLYSCFHHRKYAVLYGPKAKRRKLLAQNRDIYIINHDGVGVILDELLGKIDINCVIIDEIHEYKGGSQTLKWRNLNALVNKSGRIDYCYGLTGTPTPQAPTDAYGQSKLVTPEKVPGSFTRFKMDTMFQVGPFKWRPRVESEKIVKNVLSPSIRFGREVVTDMEPCLIERHAELSKEQEQHYKALRRKAVTEIAGKRITAVNAAVLVQKLVMTACGVVYGADGEFLEIDFGPRLAVLEELIEQNDEKVLVFVPFTGALNAIARELKKKWSVAVVDGSVAAGARDKIFRAFQGSKDPHVIIAHPATMAYSLDLTAASLIVWYAPPSGGNKIYQQACARIDGGAQKVKIDIAHISGIPEERHAYSVVQGQGRWQDVLLGLS